MSVLLTAKVIDEEPGDFVRRHCTVITEFGAATQDSGNVSWLRGGDNPSAGFSGRSPALPFLLGCMGSDPVEEQWASRESLPSCGSVRLSQGEKLKVEGKTELACMGRASKSGRGAELTIHQPATEGDPVTSYWRVTSEGSTEVYGDSTEDAFSDQKWSFAISGSACGFSRPADERMDRR